MFLSFLCVAFAAWEDGDPGIGNRGTNITTIALPSNATSACHAACVSDPACVAWQVRFSSPPCGATATCTLKSDFGGAGASNFLGATAPCYLDPCVSSGPVSRPPPSPPLLRPLAFTPAPLSSVAPAGWLADELAVQASTGQSGQLALFWGPVADSVWRGPPHSADGYVSTRTTPAHQKPRPEKTNPNPNPTPPKPHQNRYLHEDAPYLLNGVTPLAILLRNANKPDPNNLTGQVQDLVDQILAGQNASSGWLGPDDTRSGDQYWARFNVLSSFTQHAEGHPGQRPVLLRSALRYVVEAQRRALGGPFQINDWSAARAHDYVYVSTRTTPARPTTTPPQKNKP